MSDKEIEQKIKESIQQIEVRKFDEVWQDIQPKIEEKPTQRSWSFQHWMPVAASVLCVVIVASVALPNLLPRGDNGISSSDDIRYLDTELEKKKVDSAEFYTRIAQSDLEVVDLSTFEIFSASIYQDIAEITMGGYVEAYKQQGDIAHYFKLNFYDIKVETSDKAFSDLDLSYTTVHGAIIEYKFMQLDSVYFISATYKNINYYMEYTYGGGDITEFFEEFFL